MPHKIQKLDLSIISDLRTLEKKEKQASRQRRITASLFGTIDAITGKFLCTKADTCNAESFQEFLNYILKISTSCLRYLTQDIIMPRY
ncbi:hypothetical protein [Bacillus cereus]|uniref:hypothetical protein n=1 Tax=Bacillus cereus TaxID=1396 RepID=UPI001CEF8080|nr:hypothetical protein [Bacillus cereus]